MLTVNRYSEKTYEKSGVRPVAKTKENVAENNVFTAVFRAQENTRWTSRFSGVHRRKTPNSPDVFRRAENGWQIANFPKIPLLVKLPVNEGFLAVRLKERRKKVVFWTSSETMLDVLCTFTISFCFSVAIFRANTFVLARGVSRSETIISRYSSRVILLRGTFHFDFGEVFRRSHESSFFYDLFVDF